MTDNHADQYNPRSQIEVLPDDVLLEIFDFCVVGYQDFLRSGDQPAILISGKNKHMMEWWQPLIHVCRRWRCLVFGSPRRLNLRLCCMVGTAMRKTLDVWPALPLIIVNSGIIDTPVDNLISVLEHSDRICQIHLDFPTLTTSQFEKVWTAMQVPFPELTALTLDSRRSPSEIVPVVPDSFLGGSAPRLRALTLFGTPFSGLQKLLLSATQLVELHLIGVPHSGYISPGEMVTCLSVLTSLERLELGFESPQSGPDQENEPYVPTPTRSVLPTVMAFRFKGVNEYLEDLLARIDAPRLYRLWITFFNDIDFDTRQLIQFVGRTLSLKPPNEARVAFNNSCARFKLQSQASNFEMVEVYIPCREPNWQLSALAQICTSFSPLLSAAESLSICEDFYPSSKLDWKDGIENTEWLEFLFPFTAVKNFYLSKEFGPRIAPALQELTEGRMTAVLSALQNIFLEGFQPSESVEEGIGRLISSRQLTNHPITISSWDRDQSQYPLLVDGYVSRSFGPRVAERHLCNILKSPTIPASYRFASDGSFLVTLSDRSPRVLDRRVMNTGTVIPQILWFPHTVTDRRQHVQDAELQRPIFFLHTDGRLGLTLEAAASGRCHTLLNSRSYAPLGPQTTTHIRIGWRGYREFRRQVQTRDETVHRNTITLSKFAQHVGRSVDAFLKNRPLDYENPASKWSIGVGGIQPHEIIIIGAIQVSSGGWMPILQLTRYIF